MPVNVQVKHVGELPKKVATGRPSKYFEALTKVIAQSKDWQFEDEGWFQVASFERPRAANNAVGQIKSGSYPVPEGDWEFASRSGVVYAKYHGPVRRGRVPDGVIRFRGNGRTQPDDE